MTSLNLQWRLTAAPRSRARRRGQAMLYSKRKCNTNRKHTRRTCSTACRRSNRTRAAWAGGGGWVVKSTGNLSTRRRGHRTSATRHRRSGRRWADRGWGCRFGHESTRAARGARGTCGARGRLRGPRGFLCLLSSRFLPLSCRYKRVLLSLLLSANLSVLCLLRTLDAVADLKQQAGGGALRVLLAKVTLLHNCFQIRRQPRTWDPPGELPRAPHDALVGLVDAHGGVHLVDGRFDHPHEFGIRSPRNDAGAGKLALAFVLPDEAPLRVLQI